MSKGQISFAVPPVSIDTGKPVSASFQPSVPGTLARLRLTGGASGDIEMGGC